MKAFFSNTLDFDNVFRNAQSMESILDRPHIQNEVRQNFLVFNKNLLQRPAFLKKLISYALYPIDQIIISNKLSKPNRYSFLSSQILSLQNIHLYDFLLQKFCQDQSIKFLKTTQLDYDPQLGKEILDMIFEIIQLGYVQSYGYFNQIIAGMAKTGSYQILYYIVHSPQTFETIKKFLTQASITDLLVKLIIENNKAFDLKSMFLRKIFHYIIESDKGDMMQNGFYMVEQIRQKVRQGNICDRLVRMMIENDVQKFFKSFSRNTANYQYVHYLIKILSILIYYISQLNHLQPIYISTIPKYLKHISKNYLEFQFNSSSINLLKIAHYDLLRAVSYLKNQQCRSFLGSIQFINLSIKYLKKFESNDFYLTMIEKLFKQILNNYDSEIVQNILLESNLIHFLLNNYQLYHQNNPRFRIGAIPFIVEIGSLILKKIQDKDFPLEEHIWKGKIKGWQVFKAKLINYKILRECKIEAIQGQEIQKIYAFINEQDSKQQTLFDSMAAVQKIRKKSISLQLSETINSQISISEQIESQQSLRELSNNSDIFQSLPKQIENEARVNMFWKDKQSHPNDIIDSLNH